MAEPKKEETQNVDTQIPEDELLRQQIMLEKDQKILELEKKVVELDKKAVDLTARSLKVFEKNQELQTSPELIAKNAQLDYELKIAKQFSSSKAFPSNSPEQIYVLMKAGEEMGLSPIVSLNMLYVVNGHIGPYGDKMLGHILRQGYQVHYHDEDVTKVSVTIYKKEGDQTIEKYTETATVQDQIIKKSMVKGAASFALKNKLRFHAIRMIASFHLPHLFMGCSDNFTQDFKEWQEGEMMKIKDQSGSNTIVKVDNEELHDLLVNCADLDELLKIEKEHNSSITRNLKLASELGKAKKRLS